MYRNRPAVPVLDSMQKDIEHETRVYFHAFMRNWNHPNRCQHSNGRLTCSDQPPCMWQDGTQWRVGCPNVFGNKNWHYVQTIQSTDNIYPDFLKTLVEGYHLEPDYQESDYNCFFVANRMRNLRTCSKFNIFFTYV